MTYSTVLTSTLPYGTHRKYQFLSCTMSCMFFWNHLESFGLTVLAEVSTDAWRAATAPSHRITNTSVLTFTAE